MNIYSKGNDIPRMHSHGKELLAVHVICISLAVGEPCMHVKWVAKEQVRNGNTRRV